jgi:hypothetical protein
MAFNGSFGNKKNGMSAISQRGWNPLNYNLLLKFGDEIDLM